MPPAGNPAGDPREVTTKCHQSAPRTVRCRALPEAAVGEGNQGLQCEGAVTDVPIEGRCGVIS